MEIFKIKYFVKYQQKKRFDLKLTHNIHNINSRNVEKLIIP